MIKPRFLTQSFIWSNNARKKSRLKEKIGIFLLALIFLISGLILIKDKEKPIKYVQDDTSTSNPTTAVQLPVQATTTSDTKPSGKINLNKASLEDLDSLPGIGPVIAQRIIDYRTKAGGFKTLIELKEVSGIGDAKYSKVETLISL